MRGITTLMLLLCLMLPALAEDGAGAGDGAGRPFIRGIDIMKYTKDVTANQPPDERIDHLIATLKTLNVDYISIAVAMDASADYPVSHKPGPRDVHAFTQRVADAIHKQGLKIIWRGTWSGIEGISGFEKRVGERRFPAGTAASAASDGETTWLGKTRQYILNNPDFFAPGDIWAPLPERTENIFQDATSFLPYDPPGIQANYVQFFNDLKRVSDAAFAEIGKAVITGMTANNYTEVKSGWLPPAFFAAQGIVAIDYYGNERTAAELGRDIRQMHAMHRQPVFIQEWSDYWNGNLPPAQREAYLREVYGELRQLAKEGIVVGFNYWGGWTGTGESAIQEINGQVELTPEGRLLQAFFASFDDATP